MDGIQAAISLILKSLLLSAQWAGTVRMRQMRNLAGEENNRTIEIQFLRDRIFQLETELEICRKHGKDTNRKPRYTLRERWLILWYKEYFRVSTREITKRLGVARSTIYRWMRKIEDPSSKKTEPANKTPIELVRLVWEIAKSNPHWGRIRISLQLSLLQVFLAASTVRNILNRPEPSPLGSKKKKTNNPQEGSAYRSIPAWHPNHVWSVDRTIVRRWGLWPCYVLVGIDHFSRKVVCCRPLEGPNAGWTITALEQAMEIHGAPKHMISDQEPVFKSTAFTELMEAYAIKQRFGAIGKHGSIAVTERVIKTLKSEWLNRVAIVKGFDHLESLCNSFSEWYNEWRPHYRLMGRIPNDVFAEGQKETLDRNAKAVPFPIERRRFEETNTTAFRIPKAA
jgi:transposase InsO family protein